MLKHVIYGVSGIIAAIILAAAIYFDTPAAPITPVAGVEEVVLASSTQLAAVATGKGGLYTVTKVIDGDTIVVQGEGKTETVRLIGIDAPESGSECFAAEATAEVKKLLTGKEVVLEGDKSQDERDRYGRLLAYVFRADLNINHHLVQKGFVREYTYRTAYIYQQEFKSAEAQARKAGAGLWGVCAAPVVPQAAPLQTPAPTPVEESSGVPLQAPPPAAPQEVSAPPPEEPSTPPAQPGYTCATNTYNCSDFSTHAEAQAIFLACGGVDNDIHRLDSNKDGEACESLP